MVQLLLVVGYIVILGLDLRYWKQASQKFKLSLVYLIIWATGLVISYLQVIDQGPTSPVIYIERAVKYFVGDKDEG